MGAARRKWADVVVPPPRRVRDYPHTILQFGLEIVISKPFVGWVHDYEAGLSAVMILLVIAGLSILFMEKGSMDEETA